MNDGRLNTSSDKYLLIKFYFEFGLNLILPINSFNCNILKKFLN